MKTRRWLMLLSMAVVTTVALCSACQAGRCLLYFGWGDRTPGYLAVNRDWVDSRPVDGLFIVPYRPISDNMLSLSYATC